MKRIHFAKLAAVPLVGIAFISHHKVPEGSFLGQIAEYCSFTLLAVAAFGRLWCAAFIAGRKNSVLVVEGPYALMRNPLYFFSLLGFIGAGLAFKSITLATGFAALFFITHWRVIAREEVRLAELFGESFRAYTRKVPRFVPNPWNPQHVPLTVDLSPAILSRAILESFLLLSVFPVAKGVEQFHTAYPGSVLFLIP